jgi:cytochrome c-type biogenesis protein CcmH/NrfG
MMSAIPALLLIWAVIAACFLALLAYKGQLTRYEEDQLFLNNEDESHEQREQTEIVRKVKKIEPFVRVLGVAAAFMTVCIVSIYTYDAWQHLK